VLASKIRTIVNSTRTAGRAVSASDGLNVSTTNLLNRYLDGKAKLIYPEPHDVFPCDLLDNEWCRTPFVGESIDEGDLEEAAKSA
jgi:glucose-6-phosphate isomerase